MFNRIFESDNFIYFFWYLAIINNNNKLDKKKKNNNNKSKMYDKDTIKFNVEKLFSM